MDALICYKQTCKVVSLNLAHPVDAYLYRYYKAIRHKLLVSRSIEITVVLEIRSVERDICPTAVLCFAVIILSLIFKNFGGQ